MIIAEIRINNFGTFCGENSILLQPKSITQPVVLIGGKNGRGKTTLLDAIKLCFYGAKANCAHRGKKRYEQYLRDCIHRFATHRAAFVEVSFNETLTGNTRSWRVQRNWQDLGTEVQESLLVWKNGELSSGWADAWPELVQMLIPSNISQLFFFDGEEIKEYAEPEKLPDLVRIALHTVLGLDIIDQAQTDLKASITKYNRKLANETTSSKINDKQSQLNTSKDQLEILFEQKATIQTELNMLHNKAKLAESAFAQAGGDYFVKKCEFTQKLDEKLSELNLLETELRVICAGDAPLLLIEDQLRNIYNTAKTEQNTTKISQLIDLIQIRDKELLLFLKESNLTPFQISNIEHWLSTDQNTRLIVSDTQTVNDWSPAEHLQFECLLNQKLPGIRQKIGDLTTKINYLHDELYSIEQNLALVPDDDIIAPLYAQWQFLSKCYSEKCDEFNRIELSLRQLEERINIQQMQLDAEMLAEYETQFGLEDVGRKIEFAKRAVETFTKFKSKMIGHRLQAIETIVTQRFVQLLHKSDFIDRVRVNASTYELEIFKSNTVVPLQQLSAGERQLLVISIIWGIGQLATQTYPTIIDTPLSRLDSEHRSNLITQYFSKASPQVILLSTDQEIYGNYHEQIRPCISYEYELVFDPGSNATSIRPGYLQEC